LFSPRAVPDNLSRKTLSRNRPNGLTVPASI
jgi:hypothetical protein